MNLYLISQDVNNAYDTFDSAVVCANDKEEAQKMHPGGQEHWMSSWAKSEDVDVEYLGIADSHLEKGVICASFNAG